jgi:hypothetical protein
MLILKCLLVGAAALSASPAAVQQTNSRVKSIEIHSKWGGLGPAGDSTLEILRHGAQFRIKGRTVDDRLVEDILNQIDAPVPAPTLENLGITRSWLESNSDAALPDRLRNEPANEKDLFWSHFRNVSLMQKIVPEIIREGWTDDYPQLEVRVLRDDGSTTLLRSERQNIFMIPMGINERGQERLSYNARLSRAIAAVLPSGFINRERLSGAELRSVVATAVMSRIDDDLNLLETRNKIGNELKQLEGRYSVELTAINRVSSADVETLGEDFPRWNALLKRNDFPHNILIDVSLPYKDNRLVTFDLFLKNIDEVVALPLSVPWLSTYLAEHPEVRMEIRFVTDRSVSPRLASYFLETIKAFGAENVTLQVKTMLVNSTLVTFDGAVGWSRWLVLPDRRMVLFDFQGSKILKWELTDFETRTRFNSNNWHKAKAIINPQGQIESR